MQAIQDIFDIWPSTRAMADDLDEKVDTVKHWRLRKRIPSSAWPRIIEKAALREQFVTASELLRMHTPPMKSSNSS